jgi:histone demethylase JARID1
MSSAERGKILGTAYSQIAGTRANLNYLDQLAKFHKQGSGSTLNRFPSVDKRPLDLYKLKKFVEDKGGFEAVCKGKRWAEIGRDLGYSGKIMSSLSTSLKNSYQKWLQPYEDWLKENKFSVLAQQERENGGPYTPSPSQTPIKSSQNTPANNAGPASPAIRASAALQATIQESSPVPKQEPQPPRSSGFTAVNAPGFTAVNAPQKSGFSAINAPNGTVSAGPSTPLQSNSPGVSARNTPLDTGAASSANGHGPLKRQHSVGNDTVNGDDPSGRRSKRVKQVDAPTVTGSQMMQPRMPAPVFTVPRDRTNDKPGDCDICGKGDEAGQTLFCDSCDTAYHMYCLDPPPKSAPQSDWHCPRCLVGTGEFGFEEGGIYSLRQFQEKAQRFKDRHFTGKWSFDPTSNAKRPIPEEDVEREFWRLTESLTETVEVEYGADIHSTTHGSGFPTIERNPFDSYSTDPWNINVLPLDKESLFRNIKTDISGMTVPWLYVGMCFSTFCWHSEDHYTYSANYQHFGETKTWYGIPSDDAERFEAAMKETVPELFEQQPDLLFQLVTLLQPEKLRKAGVRVFALDQRAGQFVITYPRAYHAGFNHGFNFNEAVNFAPSDWEPYGAIAIQRLQDFRRQPVFSHDELLFNAAARDHTIKTAKWLSSALQRTRDRELAARAMYRDKYRRAHSQVANGSAEGMDINKQDPPFRQDTKDLTDDETVCAYCKAYGYLSRFMCKNTGKILCLLHAGNYDCCASSENERLSMVDGRHELQHRLTDSELEVTVQKVVDISRTPEAWEEKRDSLLANEPKPALKSLRSLLSEGERIDASWPLAQLADLKSYVTRCNQWVEEATTFIARKPNRRKSEMRSRGSLSEGMQKKAEREEVKKDALRNPDNIKKLLKTAEALSFDCPELEKLQDRYSGIIDFRKRAHSALKRPHITGPELDDLIDEGRDLDMDIVEMKDLDRQARTVRWFQEAKERSELPFGEKPPSLDDVNEFIERGEELSISKNDDYMVYFSNQREQGLFWESKAHQVMSQEPVNLQQLDALFKQASRLPVSRATITAIDDILKKQREAQERIMNLYEKTKDPDLRRRPSYKEVRDTMDQLHDLNSKPPGTLDLEKEQKRHEDWMRRGKKLFGKANAPLHILLQHMQYVEDRNQYCLDLKDQPRMPVEPSSRQVSPSNEEVEMSGPSRDVFCICRRPESGMMIECELCHEWFVGSGRKRGQ